MTTNLKPINSYFSINENRIIFTPKLGDDFAKDHNDFNLIHNAEGRKFYVPGDLILGSILRMKKLHEKIFIKFEKGITPESLDVLLELDNEGNLKLTDIESQIKCSGKLETKLDVEDDVIDKIIHAYSFFSGQLFPYLIVEALKDSNYMLKPRAPFVTYDTITLNLINSFSHQDPKIRLEQTHTIFKINRDSKKPRATIKFGFKITEEENSKTIYDGEKTIVTGNLSPYDQTKSQELIEKYEELKKH